MMCVCVWEGDRSLFYFPQFSGGTLGLFHSVHDWRVFKSSFCCWNRSAHSWLFCSCRCILHTLSLGDDSCLVLADSHVYKVYTCAIHTTQAILLWLILKISVTFWKFQPVFLHLSWFPVDGFCCEVLQREDFFVNLHTQFEIMKPFFHSL